MNVHHINHLPAGDTRRRQVASARADGIPFGASALFVVPRTRSFAVNGTLQSALAAARQRAAIEGTQGVLATSRGTWLVATVYADTRGGAFQLDDPSIGALTLEQVDPRLRAVVQPTGSILAFS